MPNLVALDFTGAYTHFANNQGGTQAPGFVATFTGFAANATISQPTSTQFGDVYGYNVTYAAPNTVITVDRVYADTLSNSSQGLSSPSVWTFTDTLNSVVATATFAMPSTSVSGNVVFQTYNYNDLNNGNYYPAAQFVQLGNSAIINIVGVYPYEVLTFLGGFANQAGTVAQATLGTATADANGVVAYNLAVGPNSNSYYLSVSSNTVNYTYGGFIFDQTQIISANASLISGFALTPYHTTSYSQSVILSNVAIFANSVLLGNTVTANSGVWNFVPNLSNGTYLITASAIPQQQISPAFNWPYANASTTVIVGGGGGGGGGGDFGSPSPGITVRLEWDDGPSSVDNVSSQSVIVGTATPGVPITVYDASGNILGNTTPDGLGNFKFDGDYDPGVVSITLTQGNTTVPFSFTWTAPYSNENLLQQFLALLPTGPAWNKTLGSVMRSVLRPLVRNTMRNAGRAYTLLLETFPATTRELLPAWENTLGLVPTQGETDAQRQAAVTAKFIATGGQSATYYIGIANALGEVIAINEFSSFRPGINKPGQVLRGYAANWIWQVVANASANATTLASAIEQLAPAHTVVYFDYV